MTLLEESSSPSDPGGRPGERITVILTHTADVPILRSMLPGIRATVTLVAAAPPVAWELESAGMPFSVADEFFDPVEMVAPGMENFVRAEAFCGEIDAWLAGAYPSLRDLPLAPATDHFFSVKMLFDALAIRVRILRGMIARTRPDLLVTFVPEPAGDPAPPPTVPFGPAENIYAMLLGLEGWRVRVQLVSRSIPDLPATPGAGTVGRGIFPRYLARFTLPYYALSLAKHSGIRPALAYGLSDLRNRVSSRAVLALRGFGYNWNEMLPLITRQGYRVIHLPDSTGSDQGPVLFPGRLPEIPESILETYGTIDTIRVAPLLKERAGRMVRASLSQGPGIADAMNRTLDRVRPDAILFGTKVSLQDRILARLASLRGIPVISWQHGSQGLNHSPMALHSEVAGSTVHLCFGKGVVGMYEKDRKGRFPCRLEAVGSYELELLRNAPSRGAFSSDVLYVTTNYFGNNLYVYAPSVCPDSHLWDTQKAILGVLGESGKRSVLKLHPLQREDRHFHEFLRARNCRTIRIIRDEMGYLDLLSQSRAVVIDYPSTTLLQAVATRKPVFVLLRHFPLAGEAETLLRRRAFCSADLQEFTALLRDYLHGDDAGPHPDVRDTAFLEAYGITRDDGQVAHRALGVLAQVLPPQ